MIDPRLTRGTALAVLLPFASAGAAPRGEPATPAPQVAPVALSILGSVAAPPAEETWSLAEMIVQTPNGDVANLLSSLLNSAPFLGSTVPGLGRAQDSNQFVRAMDMVRAGESPREVGLGDRTMVLLGNRITETLLSISVLAPTPARASQVLAQVHAKCGEMILADRRAKQTRKERANRTVLESQQHYDEALAELSAIRAQSGGLDPQKSLEQLEDQMLKLRDRVWSMTSAVVSESLQRDYLAGQLQRFPEQVEVPGDPVPNPEWLELERRNNQVKNEYDRLQNRVRDLEKAGGRGEENSPELKALIDSTLDLRQQADELRLLLEVAPPTIPGPPELQPNPDRYRAERELSNQEQKLAEISAQLEAQEQNRQRLLELLLEARTLSERDRLARLELSEREVRLREARQTLTLLEQELGGDDTLSVLAGPSVTSATR